AVADDRELAEQQDFRAFTHSLPFLRPLQRGFKRLGGKLEAFEGGHMTIDEKKLGGVMKKIVAEGGAAMRGAPVLLGDRRGLYRAMAALGPTTPAELATRTETAERYVREWLNAQAAGGYVTYDAASGKYALPAEQAFALADESSPVFCPGLFQVTKAVWDAD